MFSKVILETHFEVAKVCHNWQQVYNRNFLIKVNQTQIYKQHVDLSLRIQTCFIQFTKRVAFSPFHSKQMVSTSLMYPGNAHTNTERENV